MLYPFMTTNLWKDYRKLDIMTILIKFDFHPLIAYILWAS